MRAARLLTLALAFVLLGGAAPPADTYSPWVRADIELGGTSFRADAPSVLMRTRLSMARAVVLDEEVRQARAEPLLNAFYHIVPAQSVLYVLGREHSEKIVACTTTDTHVAANIFSPEGRIDSPTCFVDNEPDGRFDEVRWGAWSPRTHALLAQTVVAYDPAVAIDLAYEVIDAPPTFAATQFLEVLFAVDPDRGVIEASVRGPDGAVLRRERLSLRRVRTVRTFEFFASEIEVARVSESEFTWRPLRTPPVGHPFRLTWRGD
ncbi:MAG: hypothetical protein ACREH4_00850 [Vitreimonas sp.]